MRNAPTEVSESVLSEVGKIREQSKAAAAWAVTATAKELADVLERGTIAPEDLPYVTIARYELISRAEKSGAATLPAYLAAPRRHVAKCLDCGSHGDVTGHTDCPSPRNHS
jgi:hypothetical protein